MITLSVKGCRAIGKAWLSPSHFSCLASSSHVVGSTFVEVVSYLCFDRISLKFSTSFYILFLLDSSEFLSADSILISLSHACIHANTHTHMHTYSVWQSEAVDGSLPSPYSLSCITLHWNVMMKHAFVDRTRNQTSRLKSPFPVLRLI